VTRAVSGLATARRTLPLAGVVGVGLAAAVVIALVHVTQGTADVALHDQLFGGPDEQATAVVVGLAASRGGWDSDRLVLIGVGVSAAAAALTTFVIVLTDPWNVGKALTWLSGSTYGRTFPQVAPVAVTLALVGPALWQAHRMLDLLAMDEDTARVVGVPVDRARPVLLGVACLLTATAVWACVGLVAAHAARVPVGAQHRRVLPVAALLGALLVSVADTLGRTVIAPGQLPAGLLAALVGTPYFVWLLWRSRI